MPTPNERKALWFLAIVALSGSAVRVVRARTPPPSAVEEGALERQLGRIDSVRSARDEREASKGRGTKGRARGTARAVSKSPAASTGAPAPQPPVVVPSSPSPNAPIDLDRASAAEIEALPGIGPALAQRIVRHRDSAGAFGGLDALCDVRGIGPKLAEKLRPLVTFTGPRRPVIDACGTPAGVARKRRGS